MVDQPRQYSAAEMERMMRVQDALLKTIAKKITWWAAARATYGGLAERRKGKPGGKRISLAQVAEVLRLYKEMYYDLNIRHFHEELQTEHQIKLSCTWVQRALQGADLV